MSSGSAGICTTLDSGFRRVETISADRSVGVASATDFVVAACDRFSLRSGPRGACLNVRGGRDPREFRPARAAFSFRYSIFYFNYKNYSLYIFDKLVSLESMFSILGDTEALEKFGIRLKALRLRRNLSQVYVAGVVGVSVPTYRKIEQGDGTVEFRHVARALGALGLAEELGDVIPETEPELRLKDLLRPERKHASKPRRKG